MWCGLCYKTASSKWSCTQGSLRQSTQLIQTWWCGIKDTKRNMNYWSTHDSKNKLRVLWVSGKFLDFSSPKAGHGPLNYMSPTDSMVIGFFQRNSNVQLTILNRLKSVNVALWVAAKYLPLSLYMRQILEHYISAIKAGYVKCSTPTKSQKSTMMAPQVFYGAQTRMITWLSFIPYTN